MYQIVKVVNLPLPLSGKRSKLPTTEVWQPVGQPQMTEEDGERLLQKFRDFNKGGKFFYKLVRDLEL